MSAASTINSIAQALRDLSEKALLVPFVFAESVPKRRQQYWTFKVNFFDTASEVHVEVPCGVITGPAAFANCECDINAFFENNDRLLDLFAFSATRRNFDSLAPLLTNANRSVCGGRRTKGTHAYLAVEASVRAGDPGRRAVCNETVLLLERAERRANRIHVSCMISERVRVRVGEGVDSRVLMLPFDKCSHYANCQQVAIRAPTTI